MSKGGFQETGHRVHDYGHLVARWRRLARGAGLRLQEFAKSGEFPIYCLKTHGSLAGAFYVSAGIHGDEPAGPEALACWAEANLATLVRAERPLPMFILPCLNPWGLVENRRSDVLGRDLNRVFHRNVSPIREWRRLFTGERLALGLALHEDYDGRGIYLYETAAAKSDLGAALIRACASKVMPVDPRREIEDLPFKNGLLARRVLPGDVDLHPEAFAVFPQHTDCFITFETPSEFSLAARVQAHVRLIEACVRHLLKARR